MLPLRRMRSSFLLIGRVKAVATSLASLLLVEKPFVVWKDTALLGKAFVTFLKHVAKGDKRKGKRKAATMKDDEDVDGLETFEELQQKLLLG
jgi:hypothetical protein